MAALLLHRGWWWTLPEMGGRFVLWGGGLQSLTNIHEEGFFGRPTPDVSKGISFVGKKKVYLLRSGCFRPLIFTTKLWKNLQRWWSELLRLESLDQKSLVLVRIFVGE